MDAVLQTNSDDPSLGLFGVERFGDGSGFCAELIVRSYGFAGRQRFCVEDGPFREFAEAVARMDRELRGAARLKPLWEDEHVALELTRTGSLWVRGEVRGFALEPQLLQFAFRTDQTALAPFAESLRACLSLAAA
jgi:hypothetical protein